MVSTRPQTEPTDEVNGTHALVIHTCGTIEDVILPDCDVRRAQVYNRVFAGDMIDVLPINRLTSTECIIGDMSLGNGSAINMPANIWLVSTGRYYGLVCGPVLVVGVDLEGRTVDVPPQVYGEIPNFRTDDPRPVLRYFNPVLAEKFDAAR